jgi:transcriptional regulator with XRE-family HTH domain
MIETLYIIGMITGVQMKMARAAIGWSVRDLAAKAGVHHNTISRIENGEASNKGTLLLIRQTLESAGVEFIAENGGGAGVRLRKG